MSQLEVLFPVRAEADLDKANACRDSLLAMLQLLVQRCSPLIFAPDDRATVK